MLHIIIANTLHFIKDNREIRIIRSCGTNTLWLVWLCVVLHHSRRYFSRIFQFQLLGECHCWCTKESPRTHVAKFYGRLRLIRCVLRASIFSVLQLIEIVILWVYYTIPFGFSFFRHFWHHFSTFKLVCLAKDHWRGFSTRNAHMDGIVT